MGKLLLEFDKDDSYKVIYGGEYIGRVVFVDISFCQFIGDDGYISGKYERLHELMKHIRWVFFFAVQKIS